MQQRARRQAHPPWGNPHSHVKERWGPWSCAPLPITCLSQDGPLNFPLSPLTPPMVEAEAPEDGHSGHSCCRWEPEASGLPQVRWFSVRPTGSHGEEQFRCDAGAPACCRRDFLEATVGSVTTGRGGNQMASLLRVALLLGPGGCSPASHMSGGICHRLTPTLQGAGRGNPLLWENPLFSIW